MGNNESCTLNATNMSKNEQGLSIARVQNREDEFDRDLALALSADNWISERKDSDAVSVENIGKSIKVESFHLSCKSDKGWAKGVFGGIVIYSMGLLKPKTGVRIKPGYVFIKDGRWLESQKTAKDEGQVHGVCCRILTGWQPSMITRCGGCTSGFSIKNGILRARSISCNTKGIYNTIEISMNSVEEKHLQKALDWWKSGGSQNYYV